MKFRGRTYLACREEGVVTPGPVVAPLIFPLVVPERSGDFPGRRSMPGNLQTNTPAFRSRMKTTLNVVPGDFILEFLKNTRIFSKGPTIQAGVFPPVNHGCPADQWKILRYEKTSSQLQEGGACCHKGPNKNVPVPAGVFGVFPRIC